MVKAPKKLPERPLRYSEWPAQPFWPSFLEKFLLAIIDANPPEAVAGHEIAASGDRQVRLELALAALIQQPRSAGRDHQYDLPALMQLARAKHVKDAMKEVEVHIGVPEKDQTRAPSLRSAARQFEGLTEGNSSEARAETLRRHARDSTVKDYITTVAMNRFHMEEEDMLADLSELASILARWNVPMKIDVEALAMASLWGSNRQD
jgi:hypothetical protein